MSEMVMISREVVERIRKRVADAFDEPNDTWSDRKALKEVLRHLRLIDADLRAALAAGEARPEPVMWLEAQPGATLSDAVCGMWVSTMWHRGPQRPTKTSPENELWALYAAAPPQPAVTDEMVTRAFAAWQRWRDYDDEARMRAALVAAMGVRNG